MATRFFMMNTLFNLVDACLFSDLVVFFEKQRGSTGQDLKADGVYSSEMDISFTNLFNDIRTAVDTIHGNGELKNKTIEMIDQLVERSPKLSLLLDRLEKGGKKVFLLTNSGFSYTDKLMSVMLNGFNEEKPNWKDYFGTSPPALPQTLIASQTTLLCPPTSRPSLRREQPSAR
jgi:5'-nucleotidase